MLQSITQRRHGVQHVPCAADGALPGGRYGLAGASQGLCVHCIVARVVVAGSARGTIRLRASSRSQPPAAHRRRLRRGSRFASTLRADRGLVGCGVRLRRATLRPSIPRQCLWQCQGRILLPLARRTLRPLQQSSTAPRCVETCRTRPGAHLPRAQAQQSSVLGGLVPVQLAACTAAARGALHVAQVALSNVQR